MALRYGEISWSRGPRFQNGHDLRQKPYTLFRVKIGGSPVALV
jgi:hypothetical protein